MMRNIKWYHGTEHEIEYLPIGSRLTNNYELARTYSYMPSIISFCKDGSIMHNGKTNGYIYVIDEEINNGDIIPYPYTTMPKGKEWSNTRELKVSKIDVTVLDISEIITGNDIGEYYR